MEPENQRGQLQGFWLKPMGECWPIDWDKRHG